MFKKITLTLLLLMPNISNAKECVIFLHGLIRTASSMEKMAKSFEEAGFETVNLDYASRDHTIEELAPMAIAAGLEHCGDAEKVHFVTHSLGGILVRYYLANNKIDRLGRVVMMAPPNQGSEVADDYRNIWGYEMINGPAGMQLGTDNDSIPLQLGKVDFELGIIAGTRSINPILSLSLENPDDGKVSLEKTKIEGMADFLVVSVSHTFIMKNKLVIQNAINFIQTGRFTDTGT